MLRFALRFMVYDRPKSIGVVLGIIVSTFLVGQQIGIFLYLTGSMSALVDHAGADLWVVDNQTTNVNALGEVDMRIGRQVASIPGVARVHPLVLAGGTARFAAGQSAPVTIVGAQGPEFRGGPWNVIAGRSEGLLEEGAVSVDYFDRNNLNEATVGTNFEINGRRVHVVLETRGARGFGATYVFTAIERARALGGVPKTQASAFLVDLEGGADPLAVCAAISRAMPAVRAWTAGDFSKATVRTVLSNSGIAFSIGTLIIFATLAGMLIIGLIMYSAAVDRLRDYGTMKAIGATNAYVRNLIFAQAIAFALLGYGIGIVFLEGFRNGIANSGVLFEYSAVIKAAFFVLTMVISLGGAVLAMRRIARVEPASVFRG